MNYIYFLLLFLCLIQAKVFAQGSHRKCIVLPINSSEVDDLEFHTKLVRYIQSSDWCISKSTNELNNILNKHSSDFSKFIYTEIFRKSVVNATGAKSLIYIRKEKSKYFIEVWDDRGRLHKGPLGNDLTINQATEVLNKYKNVIPYKAMVLSKDKEIIIVDGGTRFGFHKGDNVQFLSNGRSIFHPMDKSFINFAYDESCYGTVKMSNYKSSYVVKNKNCKKVVNTNDWVRLIDNVKPTTKKQNKIKSNNVLDVVTGFGISSFGVSSSGSSVSSFKGPKFSFSIDTDLLLTRNIVFGVNLTGLFSVLSLSEGTSDADLLNTFGNQWSSYVSYRYWLQSLSRTSFIDFGLGYSSNYFGFNNSPDDLISGQKYYGLSMRGNIGATILGVDFFGKLSFFPSASFSQDINYISSVDSISGYSIQLGAFFDLYSFQNLFSLLKIEKYKASSAINSRETTIQDIGFVIGYKFKI